VEYVPTSGSHWPIVLVIHGGGWHGGGFYEEDLVSTCLDLRGAGYLVFGIDYRLADPGMIPGQAEHDVDPTSGGPLDETNDIKQQVLSARHDSRGNGKVFVVGGSAGGSHAIFAALDPAANGVPGWSAATLVDAAVSLSGAYNYSLRLGEEDAVKSFVRAVTNYTSTDKDDYAEQYALSPVALVISSTINPLYLIHSANDPMPVPQQQNMIDTLIAHGVTNYEPPLTIPGDLHEFHYWHAQDGRTPSKTVGEDVIDFLNRH
jgi:acetyl esterase/lipase